MNKNLVWILGGCAVLLLVCCVVSGVVIVVFGDQVQKQISAITGTGEGLEVPPALPPVPVGGITPIVTGVNPTPIVPPKTSSSAASSVAPVSGNPSQDALGKVKVATKYRVEFSWIFGAMQSGKYQEQAFFNMAGEVESPNAHLTSKGGLLAFLTPDPNTNLEIIEAGGKTYMKGVNMFGLTDPKVWYIMDSSSTSGFSDFAKPDEWQDFAGGGKLSDFKKVRTESLDGQSCDVYTFDFKNVQNAAIVGMLGSSKDKSDFSAVDKAETSVWLCGDGYVHKYTVDYEGHDAKTPTEKGALRISAHMWDFNNATIKVTAPADAKPMPGTR